MKSAFFFLILFLLNKITFANHYRGVVSTSEWLDNDLFYFKAQFYYRLNDNGAGSFVKCDDKLISSKTIKKDESTFSLAVYKCDQSGICGNALVFLENSFVCNSYSINEDWSIVDKLEKVNIKSNNFQEGDSIVAKFFTAYGEWSDLHVGYAWTHFSRKVKNKNNNWNHPPSTKTFPKYNLIKGCETKLQIPVDDVDDDTIRCRPSLQSAGECVNCNFRPAYLDQETCTIVFPANVTEPLIIEIQIEDFSNEDDTKPMSSVPLQFMATLTLADQNCHDYLLFTSAVPPDNSCNAIAEKTQYNNRFEFNSTSNVTDVFLNAFDGFIKGSLTYGLDYNLWFFNYSINARSSDVRQESITVYAKSAKGYSSEIRKLQYVLNYIPPSIIDVYPLGDICQKSTDSYNWTFITNRNVSSPEKTSYIKFMQIVNEDSLKLAYKFNMLTLNKNNFESFILSVPISQLELNKNYSILIDFGAIITLDYCKPQSAAIKDLKKYQFKVIGELSKEVMFMKLPPRYTNCSLLKLEWKFLSYGKKSDCLIMYKNTSFYIVSCNETSLELHNQSTGQYNFQVRYSTKCSASLLSSQISWFVVNEKPIVEITILNLLNGYASNNFTVFIRCNHVLPCNILCKFSTKDKINFQNFENCSATYKPKAQLVHLEYYEFQVYAKDEAENEANIVKVEFIADTKPPQFKNTTIELELYCGGSLDSIAKPFVEDDTDHNPSLHYTDIYHGTCSISRMWITKDYLNNIATLTQTITFISLATLSYVKNLTVHCVTNQQFVQDLKIYQDLITLENNLCNRTLDSTPTILNFPSNDCDFTFNVRWKIKDTCSISYQDIIQTVIVGIKDSPYSPLHLQSDVSLYGIFFKWPLDSSSGENKVYLRSSKQEKATLIVSVTANSWSYQFSLDANTDYYWNVVYVNANNASIKRSSPFWQFKTKSIGDLALDKVKTPNELFVGYKIQITWTVKNVGKLTTSSSLWYDHVFGSSFDNINTATLLGHVRQNRFVEPNGQYTSQFSYEMDERITSNYFYVFVIIDYTKVLEDSDYSNNVLKVPNSVKILQVPLPNLIPKTISLNPDIIQAGEDIEIRVTVENNGEGNTKLSSAWTDSIKINLINSQNVYSATVTKAGIIKIRNAYVIIKKFKLPTIYYGYANVVYQVNTFNTLYEASIDDNSLSQSLSIVPPNTPRLVFAFSSKSLTAKTGEIIQVKYSVKNDGVSSTVEYKWVDFIRIVSITNDEELLSKQLDIYETLKPGDIYTRQIEFYIDWKFNSGLYKIIISADFFNNVFSTFTSIKTIAFFLTVELVKTKWSLKGFDTTIKVIKKDREAVNTLEVNYTINVDYPFKTTSELVWTDVFYLSDLQKFEESVAIKLFESNQRVLATNGNENKFVFKKIFYLDNLVYGDYYLYIFVDKNQLIEKLFDFSSPIKRSVQINKIISLLRIFKFNITKDPQQNSNGYNITVAWKLENIGNVTVEKPQFTFYGRSSSGSSFQIGSYISQNKLYPQDVKDESTQLILGLQLYGTFTITIKWQNAMEGSSDSTQVFIQQFQSADLSVRDLYYTNSLEIKENIKCNNYRLTVVVTYTVENIAYSMNKLKTWTDNVAVVCDNDLTISKNLNITKQLWSLDTYTNYFQFLFSLQERYYPKCKVIVNVNADNGALELFSFVNNLKEQCCFSIPTKPEARFILKPLYSVSKLNLWKAGSSTEMEYTIKNEGNSSKYSSSTLIDSVYLHRKQNGWKSDILTTGILLGRKAFDNFELGCGESSANNYTIRLQIPKKASGKYFGYLINDPQNTNVNSFILLNSNFEVDVLPIEQCNIASTNGTIMSAENNFSGGDKIKFSFEVYNFGKGLAEGSWYDAVYLSKFATIVPNNPRLITIARQRDLNTSDFYKVDFELTLPLKLSSGLYFIVFVTDTTKVLFDSDYDNNQASIMIQVKAVTNADIFVTNVTVNSKTSNDLEFFWQLNADHSLIAHKCDLLYLSFDNNFDYIYDFELSDGYCEAFKINVVTGTQLGNINYSANTLQLPLLPDGSYYGIVRTITNVEETNFENNAGVSEQSVVIEVLELHINVYQEVLIKPNQNNLFKFKPDSKMNTLKVELKTNFQLSYNDIFIQLKTIPTENSYVSKSSFSYSFNQSSIVRNLKSEKYYMVVKSYLATTNQPYSAIILIKNVQEIEIEEFEPTKLSVKGKNTVKIVGNFVPQKLEVCLKNISDASFLICAVKVYKVNIEIVFATFDLSDFNLQTERIYQLTVNNKSADQVVEVFIGKIGSMQLKLEVSRRLYRQNETAYVNLVVNNNGDTDIYVPVVLVSCVDLKANFFKNDLKNLPESKLLPEFEIVAINNQPYPSYFYDYLIALNTNYLGGVLQPRSSTTLRLKVRPINSEFLGQSKITAIPYENSFFFNFVYNNIDSYKPPFFTDGVWKQLSELLVKKVNQNSREMLHETINELTTNGVEIYRLSDLVIYHIFRLDGAFFTTNLIDSVDFDIISNEVAYIRSYSAKYSSRNTKNVPLGMGWTDNLHIRLEKIDYDSLLLTLGGKQYSIDFRTSNTSYFSDILQIDIYGDTAIIILKENNLIYEYNFTENCILSLATITGNKHSTVNCRKGLIYEIFNAESTIQFTYTTKNILQTITKKSSNSPKETFTLAYDLFDRLIEFTTPSVVVKYEYDTLNNLVKAATSYNSVFKYEFNKDNLVSRITNYVNDQTVLDYNYTYYDYGPIEMHDQINGIKVRYFYDLNGRLLYYEKNERRRVHFVSSIDLSKSTILVNGEIVKRIDYDEMQNSVNQIFSDESLSSRKTVFKNETYEVIEYSDRLNNKIKLIKQLVNNNTQIEELILPNNLKERKVFDLKKNVLQIQTRNNDELTLKYDDNMNRVFYSHSTGDELNTCSYEYTEQGYLSAARGKDDYYSIYNSYDAFGKLIKTQMKSDLIVEYIYNDKSNLVEMKTNQNINFIYTRDQNERVTQLIVNGDSLVLVNYTQNGFRLFLPKVLRYFDYIYSANNGQLISYAIGDMQDEKNLVRYEYEYNQKDLLKTLKLYTGVNQCDYVTNYYYDSLNRLVSVKNDNLNTTVNVLYDSNGNRLRYQEHIGFGDEQLKENEYIVNQMNQYLSDGVNFYTYDLNGNVIEERDKSQATVKIYKYYKDGKLSQFLSKDDNCSLKYDCLERISHFNCTKAGLFIFSYQYNNKNPLSIKLSNKTVIYFLYIPGIETSIGFIMDYKVIYFEYNGYFFVQQVHSPGTIVKPPRFTPNPNPIMPGNPVVFPDLPFDIDTLLPRIDLNTTLGPSNKPMSTTCNTNLGQSVFDIDSVFNQNPIFTSTINKLPRSPNMNHNTLENPNDFEPLTLSPSIFPEFLQPKSNDSKKPCLIFDDRFRVEKITKTYPLTKLMTSVLDNIGDSSKWVDAACSAAGSFFKQYFLKNNTFKDSLVEILKGSNTYFIKKFICDELTAVDIGNKIGEKVVESLVKKIPYKSKCLKNAIVGIFSEITEFINWTRSIDPNDIIGPQGYGANNYVSNNQKFIFVINFENMANASAPAQLVEVVSQLDDQFNYASILFTRYGFNSFEKKLNNLRRPYLSEILELELFNLRVFATINPLNRKMIWQIKTLDKVTGNIPDDASLGFLPPSNGTHGKGFVEFLVLLKPNLPHLTTVTASASIVFDQNDAIETNIIVYTIDAILPEISMEYIPNGNYILINATDKGSGVNSITVYNGTEEIIFLTVESISSFELPLNNHSYNIYYTAQDNVLNSLPLLFFNSISNKLLAGSNGTCHNNCSGNGVCLNAFCQCIDGFKGDNCNVKISNKDLLNEPPNVDIGYLPTNTRGLINLFVKANEENPMLMQINNIPEDVLIKYKNQIITSIAVISLNSKNATILTVQSQLGNRTFFNFEVNISTTRLNSLTNRAVTISTVFYYPINMNNFEIEYTFQIFVNCYNKSWNNNFIVLLSEQISDFDVVSIDSYQKPSFIKLNLVKMSLQFYRLEVNSANTNFSNIDFFLKLKVNSTNVDGQYKIKIVEIKIESYKMCNDSLSSVFPPENQIVMSNKQVITGLVVGPALTLIVITTVIVKLCKRSKNKRAAVV